MLAGRARFLSVVIGGCFCLAAVPAFAQPGGGGFGFGGPTMLLANPEVVKELELTDDQVDQVKVVSDKAREALGELFRGGGGRGGNNEERTEKMRTLNADSQKQIDKILLPHQVKRLKQLEFQQRVARAGTTGAVTSETAVEALEITDSQKEALTEKAKEIEADLRQKMAKLRAEAQAKLLEALTPAQRAKWKEVAGDPFDFGRGGGFGGFGGGQPGGGRPGGGRPGGGNRPGGNTPRPDA
jgi:Spy/CpxP family protein refolding chaperone